MVAAEREVNCRVFLPSTPGVTFEDRADLSSVEAIELPPQLAKYDIVYMKGLGAVVSNCVHFDRRMLAVVNAAVDNILEGQLLNVFKDVEKINVRFDARLPVILKMQEILVCCYQNSWPFFKEV